MKTRYVLIILLAIVWYDITSLTPSSIDKAIAEANATISAAKQKQAGLRMKHTGCSFGHGVMSKFTSGRCAEATDKMKTRVQDSRWLVEVHEGQAELHLDRLEELRGIEPEMIIARAEVWAWMRWFWLTTVVSSHAVELFGGSFTSDAKLAGRECFSL